MLPRSDVEHIQDPNVSVLDAISKSIKNLQQNNLVFEIPQPKNWSFTHTDNGN